MHGRGGFCIRFVRTPILLELLLLLLVLGSIFSVVSSFSRLSEKRDQSSAPSVTVNEDDRPVLRGPHNIMRTVLEFCD